jgi:hypothetical protein
MADFLGEWLDFPYFNFFFGSCIFFTDFPIQWLNFVVQVFCVMDYHKVSVVPIYIVDMNHLF